MILTNHLIETFIFAFQHVKSVRFSNDLSNKLVS